MSHSIEISDDEDSFSLPQPPGPQGNSSDNETNQLSSDKETEEESSDTVNLITSDEEDELPEVSMKIRRMNVIKELFPNAAKSLEGTNVANVDATRSKASPPKVREPGFDKMIGGVTVNLPVEPYGCQIALISKVITGIKTAQNCLLESPTGSGKTLALLCGALAWQRHERKRIGLLLAEREATRIPELKTYTGAVDYVGDIDVNFSKSIYGEKSIYDKPVNDNTDFKRQEPLKDCCEDTSEDGLVQIHKRRRFHSPNNGETSHTSSPQKPSTTPQKPSTTTRSYTPSTTPQKPSTTSSSYNTAFTTPQKPPTTPQHAKTLSDTPEDLNVPTIFYGARTHKQLQQVIKEFKRTSYCGEAKMTVLASREHSCIRVFDRQLWKTKNDMCRECIKSSSSGDKKGESNCKFYDNRTALHHGSLPPGFDLEELVAAGEEKSACPYFAAKSMASSAHIVFCPYNYLIEPTIRSNMQIELKDNIVVIDEAHNIEDICRDAASFSFSKDNILAAITELSKASQYLYSSGYMVTHVEHILKALTAWNDWFTNQTPLVNSQPVNNGEAVYLWDVANFVQTLNNHNIGQNHYKAFKHSVETLVQCLREDPRKLHGVTQATASLVEALDIVLGYLFRDNGLYMDDFKPALVRSVAADPMSEAVSWRSSQFNQRIQKEGYELRLMCMNPAVIFSGLKVAKCVILASGTLTPLHSLYSELGTDFPLKVSPNHVISGDRVWVGTLSTCPDGSRLECKSAATSLPGAQDGIGDAVLWVCRVTPHGVLVFLPSYQLMNKLARRWKETGVWRRLEEQKHVFMESRNVRDHNDIMEDYYKYVETEKGAVLFAVFRGKVSEGMDFRDHQARAVITIGIPYPNTYDMAVKEKMTYNNKYEKKRNLLNSSEWLRVQAYRALNQAVGRCVRHRGDWGAVLMLDARFTNNYYTEHLSKWLRGFLNNNHHTFESLVNSDNSLESFMQNMTISAKEDL